MTTIESPTTYKCDGCGKEEPWSEDVAAKWTSIELKSVAWLGSFDRRRAEPTMKHACSSACERRIHLRRAGEPVDPAQLEAEARAAWPDLAAQIDQQRDTHAIEVGALRAEKVRLEIELEQVRRERERSRYLTIDDLHGLLERVLDRRDETLTGRLLAVVTGRR